VGKSIEKKKQYKKIGGCAIVKKIPIHSGFDQQHAVVVLSICLVWRVW
jgi:hypothetical protein